MRFVEKESEEREVPEGDHLGLGVTLREGGHDAEEFGASVREELLQGDEGAAGRDDIIDHDDLLVLEAGDIICAEKERLLLVRRDALDPGLEDRFGHVGLLLLPGDDGRELRLPSEDMEERLSLAVRHEQDVRSLGDLGGELGADRFGELPVTEEVEEGDADARRDFPNRERARNRTDRDRMRGVHGRLLFSAKER